MTDLDLVTATATRNYAASEPLLDWLNLYGESKGFRRDQDHKDYDKRTDFSLFVMTNHFPVLSFSIRSAK